MPDFELINLKTNQITLLPGDAIKNENLRQAALELSLWDTITIGFMKVTRIY